MQTDKRIDAIIYVLVDAAHSLVIKVPMKLASLFESAVKDICRLILGRLRLQKNRRIPITAREERTIRRKSPLIFHKLHGTRRIHSPDGGDGLILCQDEYLMVAGDSAEIAQYDAEDGRVNLLIHGHILTVIVFDDRIISVNNVQKFLQVLPWKNDRRTFLFLLCLQIFNIYACRGLSLSKTSILNLCAISGQKLLRSYLLDINGN